MLSTILLYREEKYCDVHVLWTV